MGCDISAIPGHAMDDYIITTRINRAKLCPLLFVQLKALVMFQCHWLTFRSEKMLDHFRTTPTDDLVIVVLMEKWNEKHSNIVTFVLSSIGDKECLTF